ncbi:MAG: prenyltransferase [Anaerolineales bacterium]|nr:prenyltransferase [Anaerolineales bacterium]
MNKLRAFIRISRPLYLLGGVLLYALGGGIANYLGRPIDWGVYLLGQAWVILLQLGGHFLNEYFNPSPNPSTVDRQPYSPPNGQPANQAIERATLLVVAIGCLSLAASFTALLIQAAGLTGAILLVMLLTFLGVVFYSVPPLQLSSSGYGELVTTLIAANLLPAFAFLLQTGELHRLLAMATFPLSALLLAMQLSLELPGYARDLKQEKHTLLVRLGWRNGMVLHNILVLSAYLLIGLAMLFGMPLFIGLPAYLTLPLGMLQIWQMRRIAEGAKPNWNTLGLNSLVLFGATVYLLAYSFWAR